jgi:hypothetical protein
MYPASRLVRPDPRSPIVPKLLSLVAAVVLLLATLEIFSALKPGPPYLVQYGVVVPSCSIRFAGRQPTPGEIRSERCSSVTPDQKIPQRVGVGLAAIAIVAALMASASRQHVNAPSRV